MTASPRVRPDLHFTVRQGFTNDPHGIVYVDGVYHMFFQYNPDGRQWSPRCHWGHAASNDLMTWQEVEVALRPGAGEIGCWSGCVAIDDRGPAIFYTRVDAGHLACGQVVVARPRRGMFDWVRTPDQAVIEAPPGDRDVIAFRDPHVRRQDGSWKALLGAGIAGVGGCALQYSSDDLEHWAFDGVFASRSAGERDPVWTGKVWECPQLIRVGDEWVLITSTWADNVPYDVAYALGRYDGNATFVARSYGHLSHGAELYATTTFRDADGRPCAMSWLRERANAAPEGSPWASAMTLPHVLSIAGGRLVVAQHPALESALSSTANLGDVSPGGSLRMDISGYLWRLRFRVDRYRLGGFSVEVAGDGRSFSVSGSDAAVVVMDAGAELLSMPVPDGDVTDVDIVVDADILELTLAGVEGVAATRVPVIDRGDLSVTPPGGSSIRGVQLAMPSTGSPVVAQIESRRRSL